MQTSTVSFASVGWELRSLVDGYEAIPVFQKAVRQFSVEAPLSGPRRLRPRTGSFLKFLPPV